MVNPSEARACDICFAHETDDGTELVIVDGNQWAAGGIKKYPSNRWTPIGIVVIPGNHGVLKDGTGTVNQCGIISIVPMNCDTPETGGTSEQQMYWGGDGTDITDKSDGLERHDSVTDGLLNYQHVVTTADDTSNVANGYSSQNGAYIPRQGSVGGTPTRNDSPYAPSPYIGEDYKSGGYNPSYGLKDGVVETEANNALSDFKGIVNTKIITDLATGQDFWRTWPSITNNSGSGYYPAACCCVRFKTPGTKAFVDCTTEELRNGTGFWYLPAAGELGYIMPRFADINDTIGKLKTAYGVGVQFYSTSMYFSSSKCSSIYIHAIIAGRGTVGAVYKKNNLYVRAFMRL